MIFLGKKTIITKSALQTKNLAAVLTDKFLRKTKPRKNAVVFALVGDLGSGKTTFVQGFMRAMGVKKRITSPTFVLVKSYKVKSYKVYHMDCYRIYNQKEILDLGFKKIISNPQSIVLIEWAEKIRKILPKKTIWLNFCHEDKEQERIIKIEI